MVSVVIAAAGQGKRMGSGMNKTLISLLHQPVFGYSVRTFDACPAVDRLVIVVAPEETLQMETLLSGMRLSKPWQVVAGGSERQYSIANALTVLNQKNGIIVVHDGARPLAESSLVAEVIRAAMEFGAAVAGVPVKDTVKLVDESNFVSQTLQRDRLWAIQTPQAFKAEVLYRAYRQAMEEGFLGTDDSALVERLGVPVKIVRGSYCNIKITTPEDLCIAETFLRKTHTANISQNDGLEKHEMISRVGIGYDVHRLVDGRKLILGGVDVPYKQGLEGHSDADVLLHAIQDAMLGAAGLGDIGRHFPDSDMQYKGISSLILLANVRDLLAGEGWEVNNIDAVVIAEQPKLAPYIARMNETIAKTLQISIKQINIKATTTERLGFTGRQEGIAAQAVVSLVKFS
ncbi:MAG: 2-C-methyl-D-erythritol 4-phosphate cytidylyltransferase [Negativicutes bacterium]